MRVGLFVGSLLAAAAVLGAVLATNFFNNSISEAQCMALFPALGLLAMFGLYGLTAEVLARRPKTGDSMTTAALIALRLRSIPLGIKLLFGLVFLPMALPVVRRASTTVGFAGRATLCWLAIGMAGLLALGILRLAFHH